MSDSCIRITVRGHVQGVGYRMFTQRQAQALGLRGWVRNESDGTVTVVAQGAQETVQKLLAQLRQGPPASWVKGVEHRPEADCGCSGFELRF